MGDKITLAVLSGRPTIQDFAQGVAQDTTSSVADFLAPTVGTVKHTGKYKVYDKESRFKLPDTFRGLGGNATVLGFDRTDKEFNCEPHALDIPLDNIEIEEAEGEDLLKEAAEDSAFIGALVHEKTVIDMALASAGAATGGVWSNAGNDPVAEVNTAIIQVIKASGGSSILEVGLVFDPLSLVAFFANAKTKGYFPGMESIAPTVENLQKLFLGKTNSRVSFMVADTAPKGKASALEFLVANKVLVFARNPNPTRRDPSFMKTFRLRDRWMKPGVYDRQDGRGSVVKMDWSSDVQTTNSEAGKVFSIS